MLRDRESSSDQDWDSFGQRVVAQIRSTGSSLASLYELETNLALVVADLGLEALSSSDEAEIRSQLGYVIGRGLGRIAVTKN